MKRRTLLASGASAALAAAIGAPLRAQAKTKVGFIYVGPINDGGWTQHHHESAKQMVEYFGGAIDFVYQESVPEGPDAERAITQMCLGGANLIFTTSFGYMDATINVASKFPNVKFEHATGYKMADNVGVYSARFYEGRAIQGTLAGRMTKTNKVGYIASVPIPEVVRGINAAFLHARKVNPNVEFKIIWIFEWLNPAKEADAAKALIEQGCDVVLQHTDSTAPQAAAKEAGNVYTFGQAADMAEYGPMPRISSIIDNWAPYYIARAQQVIDGSWTPAFTWDGIGAGMVGIGEISDVVPAEFKAEAEAMRDAIAAGSYHPFTGPIKKQDGSDWLAAGEIADDMTLGGLNFYIEGIEGDIPS